MSRTLQALGIDPGENCITHGIVMDKKLASDMVRNSKKEFKVRRHQLQTQRLSKNTKREAKEGQTYQTGIGLNLDTSGKKERKNKQGYSHCSGSRPIENNNGGTFRI